ncbi:MAG: tRNA uridine-5-carboxymethylaminomethyl(34) synthesis enzyme MnmG [Candidatus Latescibacterota bacterium]|nr:tRNA uridine-5-carboxymethylaminomethyl(34) synthesis enzyme MnmG [Candidatus Latescibacterota bacterium]
MKTYDKKYDVIVVGGGHAGTEAALAAARMGAETLLLTMNLDSIGQMSCNPAIGGIGKGHMVKEIDALGGQMAVNIDRSGIQFRRLNTSRGPAVRASRAQADKKDYQFEMKYACEKQDHLDLRQGLMESLLVKNKIVEGVGVKGGMAYLSRSVVLTTGTFLRGKIHVGDFSYKAGRAGDPSAEKASEGLVSLGFEIGRLKTGTPPRVNGRTLDFSGMEVQPGDKNPRPFSYATSSITQTQLPCWITYTHDHTHKLVADNLNHSAMYSGRIKGVGPRYCPSIEDKIVRFSDRDRHQIFVEPEGRRTLEYYINGLSMSLPEELQQSIVRTLPGMEQAEIMRPAYAVEYDYAPPTQLYPHLETKNVENLFFAGQINGTTGYEEAAAQGIVAGINAVLKTRDEKPFVLGRADAYIGVLIDDLVTKGTQEPYRIFTSRAEHRLLLREDNADERLMEYGRKFGIVCDATWNQYKSKQQKVEKEIDRLNEVRLQPSEHTKQILQAAGTSPLREATSLAELLRRPQINYEHISQLSPATDSLTLDAAERIEAEIKYDGYIKRQYAQVEKMDRLESLSIPDDFDFSSQVLNISNEGRQKLSEIRPQTIGQASRISGISPADVSTLMVLLHTHNSKEKSSTTLS